jgi:hypothetical protein
MSARPLGFPALSVPRISDRSVLAIAFSVGIFICLLSAMANVGLLATAYPFGRILSRCNTAIGVVAILLNWRLLRWSRERNQLMRERVKVIVGLNHEIRNAIHAISLSDYHERGANRTTVKESMARIEQALDEYVPTAVTLKKARGAMHR